MVFDRVLSCSPSPVYQFSPIVRVGQIPEDDLTRAGQDGGGDHEGDGVETPREPELRRLRLLRRLSAVGPDRLPRPLHRGAPGPRRQGAKGQHRDRRHWCRRDG